MEGGDVRSDASRLPPLPSKEPLVAPNACQSIQEHPYTHLDLVFVAHFPIAWACPPRWG
jgi:hypothetical protein